MRIVALILVVLALSGPAGAEPWQRADPATSGWSAPDLNRIVDAHMSTRRPTAFLVVRDGRIVASRGDIARKIEVASIRKSLLGALIGIAVAEGRLRTDATLAQLGIDDTPPSLTDAEKAATVRDLMISSSGVYHGSALETPAMREKRPARGSHAPGTYWYYNNWDFNALGTIYRKATGEDIFTAFARRIGGPIGMEDFTAADGRYVYENASGHPAYPFTLTARDMARFGQLVLEGGCWQGRSIVPTEWLRVSTARHSGTDRPELGYGYLWWTLDPQVFGPDAAMALGRGGQHIAVVPSRRLVVVQTADPDDRTRRGRSRPFEVVLRDIMTASPDTGRIEPACAARL